MSHKTITDFQYFINGIYEKNGKIEAVRIFKIEGPIPGSMGTKYQYAVKVINPYNQINILQLINNIKQGWKVTVINEEVDGNKAAPKIFVSSLEKLPEIEVINDKYIRTTRDKKESDDLKNLINLEI